MQETEKINVLNYNENLVCSNISPTENVAFEPSADGEIPTVIPLTIDQIRYMNNSPVFRIGLLRFEEEKQKEIYENICKISNWEDILTNDQIRDILLKPTLKGLEKIVNIKDVSEFERVRAVYHKLKLENNYDVSVRVERIIETRYRELMNRKINTSIKLTTKDTTKITNEKDISNLKEQNAIMQKQLAEMQKAMQKMMASQADNLENVNVEIEVSKAKEDKPAKDAKKTDEKKKPTNKTKK
jgi:hypothetical protein